MPASLFAVAVLLTLFVPGYLFQAGFREHNNVLTAERDLYAVAQAVALSSGFLVFLLLVLSLGQAAGLHAAETVRAELLHDPTGENEPGLKIAQEVLLLLLLLLPVPFGRFFGKLKTDRDKKKGERKGDEHSGKAGLWHRLPAWLPSRIYWFFFAHSPTQQEILDVARSAMTAPIYVRVVSQGKEDVIGLMDREAALATTSPLGQGLALSWQQLPGAHIGIAGIIEIVKWRETSQARPVWLQKVPEPSGSGGRINP